MSSQCSDTLPTNPDLKTTCGIGIKLFGVPGAKLIGDGDTQDFILQNFDVFFVDTAKDMCEFTEAGVEDSVLTTTYWSGLPYALGDGRYVKYKLEPETQEKTQPPDNPDYLAQDLARRLRVHEARFRFLVQFRTDPETMSLDRATVRWEESQSQPIHVATFWRISEERDRGTGGIR